MAYYTCIYMRVDSELVAVVYNIGQFVAKLFPRVSLFHTTDMLLVDYPAMHYCNGCTVPRKGWGCV